MFYVGHNGGIPFLTENILEAPHTINAQGTVNPVLSQHDSDDDGVKLFTTSQRQAEALLRKLKVVSKRPAQRKKK